MLDQQMQPVQVMAEKPGAPAAPELAHYAPLSMMNLSELDEPNLLGVLQVLTKRRDELRQIDKQLFDMMAECFVRLKPAAGPASVKSCSDSSSGFDECNSSLASSLDDGAMDLSRLAETGPAAAAVAAAGVGAAREKLAKQEMAGASEEEEQKREQNGNKRANLASPSLHFKKQRLLSAIISTDDIGEKQQVLAEKELDVRNDGRPLISDELKQSFKLLACNSSYQQTNQHHREEYQLVGAPQLAPAGRPPPAPYHDQQQLSQQFLVSASAAASVQQQQQQQLQLQFDSGNSTASDQDDDEPGQGGASERPRLQKFCSIGSAEMSLQRFSRQQSLIDSTLATLTHSQPLANPTAAANNLLAPLAKPCEEAALAQHQRPACFGLELAPYAKQGPAMMMMPPALPQQELAHHLYDQFLQCQKSSVSLPLVVDPALVRLQHEQRASASISSPIYVFQQQQQAQQQHQQQHQQHQKRRAPSAFERLLVNAKDLGPLVRKMSFRCHVCGSCFEDRHRLQQHLSIHLNLHPSWFEEKTIKETMAQYEMRRGDYLCQACQLRFETTSEFDKHMHLHGEKPHQCELCSQDNKFVSFRYFRQLLTHLRSHCFLYSCRFVPECRQTANRKDYLKLHILKHHLNNKLPEQYTICCH